MENKTKFKKKQKRLDNNVTKKNVVLEGNTNERDVGFVLGKIYKSKTATTGTAGLRKNSHRHRRNPRNKNKGKLSSRNTSLRRN